MEDNTKRIERIAERLTAWIWRGLLPILEDVLYEYRMALQDGDFDIDVSSEETDPLATDGYNFEPEDENGEIDSPEKAFLQTCSEDIQSQLYDIISAFLTRKKKSNKG